MGKIPVLDTVGRAYAFAFGRYISLLGVVWLPLVLIGVLGYLLVLPVVQQILKFVLDAAQHPGGPDFHGMAPAIQPLADRARAFNLLEPLLGIIMAVGVTKEALGLRGRFRLAYFTFGAAELRILGAYILLIAGTAIFAIALVLAVLVAGGIASLVAMAVGAGHAGNGAYAVAASAFAIIATAIGIGAAIFLMARFFFLVLPVTVAEKRFGVMRSWELTRGNVWRIVGVVVLTLLPLFVAEGIVLAIVAVPLAIALIAAYRQGGAHALVAMLQTPLNALPHYLPWYGLAMLLLAPIVYGLLISPSAFAYQSLLANEPEASSA